MRTSTAKAWESIPGSSGLARFVYQGLSLRVALKQPVGCQSPVTRVDSTEKLVRGYGSIQRLGPALEQTMPRHPVPFPSRRARVVLPSSPLASCTKPHLLQRCVSADLDDCTAKVTQKRAGEPEPCVHGP